MFTKIVVGYDGTEHARAAVKLARALVDPTEAGLTVAGICQFDPRTQDFDPRFADVDSSLRAEVERAARETGGIAKLVPAASPERGLVELAQDEHADLIVVGSSRRSRRGRVLAGSLARHLLHTSPCAEAIAPHGLHERSVTLELVGVGYDGSFESREALAAAEALARSAGAGLRIVTVAGPDDDESSCQVLLDEALESTSAELVPTAELAHGDPATALVADTRGDMDMLFLGSRRFGPLRQVLLGSVSAEVVDHAHCAVVVLPRAVREPVG
jgi:nucleotide-binding universal stress UspA family protein